MASISTDTATGRRTIRFRGAFADDLRQLEMAGSVPEKMTPTGFEPVLPG